jgi:hypothetical protein
MRWLKRIAWFLLILVLLVTGVTAFVWYQAFEPFYRMGKAMTYNDLPHQPTVGDLGGIPISIPPGIARFVEYQDDPHFLTPRQGPPPVRTLQSKFRSFGFEMRFPDKALVHDETPEQLKKTYPGNTLWIDVGLETFGFHDERSLNRILDGTANTKSGHYDEKLGRIVDDGYTLLTEPLYGLRVYQIYGYDDAKRSQQPPNDVGDRNLYYHTNQKGEVDTYIECDNTKLDAVRCNQSFVLPSTEHTIAEVSYRIGLLPQWQAIQAAATEVILGFAVNPAEQGQNRKATLSSTITGDNHAPNH